MVSLTHRILLTLSVGRSHPLLRHFASKSADSRVQVGTFASYSRPKAPIWTRFSAHMDATMTPSPAPSIRVVRGYSPPVRRPRQAHTAVVSTPIDLSDRRQQVQPTNLTALVLGVGVLVAAVLGYRPAGGLLFGALLFVPLERLVPRHRQPVRRPGVLTDVLHLLVTSILNTWCAVVGVVAGYVLLFPLRSLVLNHRQALAAPPWLSFLLVLIGFNFVQYWHHRLSHRIAWLWRFHAVHHTSEHLDWLAGARLHPVEGLLAGFMVSPLFGLTGWSPAILSAVTSLTTLWAVFLHSNVRWRMRWLDPFVTTPEYHHWHHERSVIDRNFAGQFPIFDAIFGTRHQAELLRPSSYGIDAEFPRTWARQLLWPWRRVAR